MKRTISLVLAVMMILTLSACGGTKESAAPAQSSPEIREVDYTGTFHHDSEVFIVRDDGSVTVFDAEQKICVDGTYTKEGEQFRFSAEGTGIDGAYSTFDGYKWKIGDITYNKTYFTGSFVCKENGEEIYLNKDNTFFAFQDFENKKGKLIGTYEQDGYQWIFRSPVFENAYMTATFDGNQWIIDGNVYRSDLYIPTVFNLFMGIYIKGEEENILGKKMKNLEELGFGCGALSENPTVAPGDVTDELTVVYKKKSLASVRAINPYESEVPLSECMVCSFYTEDPDGTFQLNSNGDGCGQENYGTLLTTRVYEYTPGRLVYKRYIMPAFDYMSDMVGGVAKPTLSPSGDCDITLIFNGERLVSFRFEYPDLVYKNLSDNMDASSLREMDSAALEEAAKVRDSILDALKAEFQKENINVDINEASGEIVMDNNILFSVDSSALTDSGKAYLDSFMKSYTSVLFSEEYKDEIEQIRFEGHTDSSGSFGHNQTLSQKRADAVLDYCLNSTENGLSDEEKDLLRELAVAAGYSSTNLVYDEKGNEDAQASRRVAIKFYIDLS